MCEMKAEISNKKPTWESIYRTSWLMAHNTVHDMIHRLGASAHPALLNRYNKYLEELLTAKVVASRPG
jgi:hypothetical protein